MAGIDFEVESEIAARRRCGPSQPAARASAIAVAQTVVGERIFEADVDVALARADRIAREDHAFDQRVRIVLHQVAVDVSAGIAFVGVGDDVFLRAAVDCATARHLLPGRETRAAASAQTGELATA